jgi:hypothetical protein
MNKKILLGSVVAIILALTVTTVTQAQGSFWDRVADIAGSTLGITLAEKAGDLPAIDEETEAGETFGAIPGNEILEHINLRAGYEYTPRYLSTSTPQAGAGITAGDMQATLLTNYEYVKVSLGGAADTDFTWTLPASTSLRSFLPYVGATKEVCFFSNATTSSSGADLIFAAGTGIDLKMAQATTTTTFFSVAEEDEGCIVFKRSPQEDGDLGNLTAIWNNYIDQD